MNLSLSPACALVLALGSAAASCTFDPVGPIGAGGSDGGVEPRPDADPVRPTDAGPAPPDAPARCEEWTPRPTHFDPCELPAPSPALNLDGDTIYFYDTDDGTLEDFFGNEIAHASVELPGTPPLRAISVEGLRVGDGAELRAVGSRPLLVASWSEIVVEGTIDVSSNFLGDGAGADTGECMQPGEGGQSDDGGGGGGGGGFGGNGGGGGNGARAENGGGPGGTVPPPTAVRGGCPGGRGGIGSGGDGRGAGGAGGGALQLTARSRIDIQGRLHAGGAGGDRGPCPFGNTRSGAGGGGSGGLLDLEAPTITFGAEARAAANGGGGGEGCQEAISAFGDDGRIDDQRAGGGRGGSSVGGDGGDGSAGSNLDGTDGGDGSEDSGDRGSGGGGGGGAGYIILDGEESVTGGAVLSPPPIER